MDFSIPDSMPLFSRGGHPSPATGACVMEYISLLSGDKWTDYPKCTDRSVAWAAQMANDHLHDAFRTKEMLPRLQRIMRARPLPVRGTYWGDDRIDRNYSEYNYDLLGYPTMDLSSGMPHPKSYVEHLDAVLDHHEKLLHYWSRAEAMHLARTGRATVVRQPERATVDA